MSKMNTENHIREILKQIPSVDELLHQFDSFNRLLPYNLFKSTIQQELKQFRKSVRDNVEYDDINKHISNAILYKLEILAKPNLHNVINGTGIILHTGLGRAPISQNIIDKAVVSVTHFSNLELDLFSGKRGERNTHIEQLVNSLTGSESAIVVNNNAAAVLLMLNSLAEGKEVIISRGQQVEIGGSFRIPDVILKSGCIPIEVGATNKTHLKDYANAVTPNTGAILVAHTSNFKVMGFTKEVDLSELSDLARKKRIPLLVDLGSGAITDFQKFGLPYEDTVDYYIKQGVHLVSFSGDKLLGGPLAGIICGKKSLVKKLHQNALYRALRTDKLTISILEQTLRTYISSTDITDDNLTFKLFDRGQKELEEMGNKIINNITSKVKSMHKIKLIKTQVEAGSGSLPLEKFPSIALEFESQLKPTQISKTFRNAKYPILGYIQNKQFRIDLKAIPSESIVNLVKTINSSI